MKKKYTIFKLLYRSIKTEHEVSGGGYSFTHETIVHFVPIISFETESECLEYLNNLNDGEYIINPVYRK